MPEPTNPTTETTENQNQGEKPATWEAWLGAQPEDVKTLYEQHVTGLQNAVRATREERDGLKNQLKDLLPKAEKGSELEKSLNDALSKLEATERRAAFAEEAGKPEIGCRNPKAAYALALAENLFSRNGSPDWNAIKQAAPELFGTPGTNGNAGAGTGTKPKQQSMDTWIRQQAGR